MYSFDLEDYHYDLPEELIAQAPAPERQNSRLLLLDRPTDDMRDLAFTDIVSLIDPGDLLLFNDTRVFPARLSGRKETGGRVEIFLLRYPEPLALAGVTRKGNRSAHTEALLRSSKRPKTGSVISIGPDLRVTIQQFSEEGRARVLLEYRGDLPELLERYGEMPLPPYIKRPAGQKTEDRQRYQTVFARHPGAVAAPTAGLHFSREILDALAKKGVAFAAITLHVGYGTFSPVRTNDIRRHIMHSEHISVGEETARAINAAKRRGNKIWCVGTTATRGAEFCADDEGKVRPYRGPCDLYIYPGYTFKVVDRLLTNFHLPKSSLLILVAALVGRENILRAYRHAVEKKYRFFSYGDAMLIVK